MHCFCTYYGAGNLLSFFDFALWRIGAKDLPKFNLFCPHPQKRLDNYRFCTYNGAGYTVAFPLRFRTGAPAPKIWESQGLFEFFSNPVSRETIPNENGSHLGRASSRSLSIRISDSMPASLSL